MANMLDILWQDERIIAVDKPAGLATVPGRDDADCVLARFSAKGQSLRIVHRLDKQTSGVLLLARDRDAQRGLCKQFLQRRVEKEYLAIVAGSPAQEHGEIDLPLTRPADGVLRITPARHGQPALTRWEVVQRLGPFTLLRCFPKTGRQHQVRVHLQSIGLPLAVDPLYNPPPIGLPAGIFLSHHKRDYRHKQTEERPLIGRLTLHAARIDFCDLNGKPVSVTCPPPKDFRATINQLSKHGINRQDAKTPSQQGN
jgi:RluA family pseudouridine synthase